MAIITQKMNAVEAIEKAKTNHGFIFLEEYVSSSGQVANFQLQPLGEDGYEKLLQESIEEARKLKRPSKFDQELWEKALEGQIASYEKSLNGGHGRKDNFEKLDKAFYTHAEQVGDIVYIKHFKVVRKKVIKEGEYKAVKSKPLTLAKAYIRKKMPMSQYQGCFKIQDGKYKAVKFSKMIIESE